MIDRETRNKIACLLQDFTAGRITNQELDSGLPCSKSDDHTAQEISDMLTFNYENVAPFAKPRRIDQNGPVSRDGRRRLARIAMYLRTDLEHPKAKARLAIVQVAGVVFAVLLIPILVVSGLISLPWRAAVDWHSRQRGEPSSAEIADALWPFASLDEYEEALKHPKLLCGKQQSS